MYAIQSCYTVPQMNRLRIVRRHDFLDWDTLGLAEDLDHHVG